MAERHIVRRLSVVVGEDQGSTGEGEAHTVSLVRGIPVAVNGVSPVITVEVTDLERDYATLLRAAERLLLDHEEMPGLLVTDEAGEIVGLAPRSDLLRDVVELEMRLLADAHGPGGLITAPFVCWRCEECGYVAVPQAGHEDDPPPQCHRHRPPVQMTRCVHSGQ